jgi:hypothetical protein
MTPSRISKYKGSVSWETRAISSADQGASNAAVKLLSLPLLILELNKSCGRY